MIGVIVFVTAVLVVLATSLFKNVEMSDRVKNTIAVVLSVIAGVIVDLSTHGFDFGSYAYQDVLGTVLVIYGSAQAIYQFVLKGTEVDAKLEAVGSGDKADENDGF